MKKIFLMISLFLTTVCMADGHLKFKGIEMDGSLTNFKNALVKQGYVVVETDEDAIALKGKFAGYSDCIVLVSATPVEKLVYDVIVMMPEQDSWYSLKSRYKEFKQSLTDKYGSPNKDLHSFDSPYYEGDGYELQALNLKKCTYFANYITNEGEIAVLLTGEGRREGRVVMLYKDKVNNKLNDRAEQNSRLNDL